MIFEWYSGSDRKGEIPRRLVELWRRASGKEASDLLIDEILGLMNQEEDPNMRAKICYTAATVAGNAGKYERYQQLCRKAVECFDPLAANFRDVVEEYVRSNYGAIDNTGAPSDEYIEGTIPLKLAALLWADEAGLGEDDYALLVSGLATFFSFCAERYGLPVFWKLSLICAVRAHHRFSEDPYCLALIARAQQELGDKNGFEKVRRMVEELGYDVYNLPEP